MNVKAYQVIAGLVVLVAIVMAVTGQSSALATMLMVAALGIAVIIPW